MRGGVRDTFNQVLSLLRKRLSHNWLAWLAIILIISWIGASAALALRQHAAFHTFVYDLGYYTQVIWNTSQGRWFVNTLKPPISLADHFSPALAILAPLFWIAPDARVPILFYVIVLGLSILPAYLLLRARYPVLAVLFVLAFVFNPLLHKVARDEFHEVVLAVPSLTLALYALYRDRVWLLIVTLGFTLLVREDMGVYVASFGLYMLFCRPQRRWLGLGLIMAGIAWTSGLMLVWRPHSSYILNPFKGSAYSFSIQTALDLLGTLLSRSWNSLLATPGRSVALLQVFVALAGLPLLAAGDQLLWAPMMIFLIAVAPSYSGDLFAYRAAPLIPLLWGATANVLVRLRGRWAAAGIVMLLGTTLVGFRLWSPLPGGGRFDPSLYEVTEHDRIGQRLLAEIPPEASLAVQDGIGAHLTTRERVYLFPWFEPASPPQLIALDLVGSLTYPLDRDKIRSTVYTFRLDPAMQIVWEQDGYYLFHPVGTPQIPQQGPWVWAPWLRLEGYELSQMDREGAFRSKLDGALSGSELRVALYWTALTRMQINYVISVLLVAPDGFIVAQDDSWPGGGVLGTSAMEPRSTVRDIHYLHLPVGRGPEELRLRVIVYEADSLVRLAPEQGYILSTIPTAP